MFLANYYKVETYGYLVVFVVEVELSANTLSCIPFD